MPGAPVPGRGHAPSYDRPHGRPRGPQPMDQQIHLPGLLRPGPVGNHRGERADQDDRRRHRDAAAPLCSYLGAMVRTGARSPGRDRRAL